MGPPGLAGLCDANDSAFTPLVARVSPSGARPAEAHILAGAADW